ncbi:hypothetical protein PR202_gb22296 [Eleusine coracana subsp. coracana]|uniref:25S rRNA (uridine-N(3))-methyltransferase BMT5-like domain-containing protein n=1 Tax=Eleusine coracana subsp. coracana TaxID=191504 RepID=A0AAV5FHB8_ELECO|nr:hypothetical protein PR202_gb22296 [Eleusine coracana subsp. coracana]
MAVVLPTPEVAHAATEIGGGAPLKVAGEAEAPLVKGVLAAEGDEKSTAALAEGPSVVIVEEAVEEGPLEVAREEGELLAEGAPYAVVADRKGAAASVVGAPGSIKAHGKEGGDGVGENNVEAKEAEEEEKEAGEEKWLNHYSSMHNILTVGDGDFSFSLALATAFGSGANLVATSLDTYEVSRGKYSKAESNIMELKRLGATVLHGVDVKTMTFHTDLKNRWFDRIVFNFPHASFKGKEDDLHVIKYVPYHYLCFCHSHKELMWYFFYNARRLLRPYGEIHVTHKTGDPYDRWNLERLSAEHSLVLVMKVGFQKEDYPGSNQKRGDGARCDEPFDPATACTFKFKIGDLKKLKKVNKNRACSMPNVGGPNVHPGQWATDVGPFHPLPPVEARPPQPGQWATGRGPYHPLPQIQASPHFPPPVNVADHIPLHPYIADERQQLGLPLNLDGMVGAPYFHEHVTFCPTPSTPGPSLNDLSAIGGIPPPMGRITCPNLCPPIEHPRYEPRTVSGPPGSDGYSYFAQEYQRSLQREYDMRRHLMPGSTSSNYSAFLEHRHMESRKRQEWLRSMISLYGWQ